MATPLSAIGKYAGVLMAVMCVLLMFAFVIGDPLMQYAGGPRGPSRAGETVVTWRGGSLTESQMMQAIEHRTILDEFQRAVAALGDKYAAEAGVADLERGVRPVMLPTASDPDIERKIVLVKIIADRARDAGMVVSDDTVKDYFNRIGRSRVSNDEMRRIISQMKGRGGSAATISFVFDLMREALLVDRYQSSYQYIVGSTLPAERWRDWRRVNERIVLEAAPIPTERFLEKTPEPTDSEVAELFDLYKSRIPEPVFVEGVELPSPDPAFATPPRVRLAYLKADFNAEVQRVAEEVTPDEVAAYYEANKQDFVEADRTLFGDSSLFGPDEDEGSSSLEDLMQEIQTDEPAESAGEGGQSEGPSGEDDASPPADPTEPDAPAEPPVEPPAESTEPATEEPADDAPAEPQPSAEPQAPVEPQPQAEPDPSEEEEEEEEDAGPADEEAADSVVYQPLEDVAVEIRQRIASQRTFDALTEKMTIVKLRLDDAYVESFDTVEGDSEPSMPALLKDLSPLAEETGLELTEIDQVSEQELRETAPGMSFDFNATTPFPAWSAVFRSRDVDLYEPLSTIDRDGNRYLIMVTKRFSGETPKLDDVRDEVTSEWRRLKAAEVALEEAKKIAERASESGQPLNEFAAAEDEPAGVKPTDVFETDAFTYYVAQAPMPPDPRTARLRLSQPEPLVHPGPDLLAASFQLEAGQVGAALNHDQSIVYLLRVAQKIGTEDELRRAFLRSRNAWTGSLTMLQARAGRLQDSLMGNLMAESGLEWARPPRSLQ